MKMILATLHQRWKYFHQNTLTQLEENTGNAEMLITLREETYHISTCYHIWLIICNNYSSKSLCYHCPFWQKDSWQSILQFCCVFEILTCPHKLFTVSPKFRIFLRPGNHSMFSGQHSINTTASTA